MIEILSHINERFLPKIDYFRVFSEVDSRIEGWIKAELIFLFNELQHEGIVDTFKREYNIRTPLGPKQRRQIDFRIKIRGAAHLLELKAACISQSAGTPRNLKFYFRKDNVGIVRDLRKFDELPGNENKWLLAFIYPSPNGTEWENTVSNVAKDFSDWKTVTSPMEYPEHLFISLWHLDQDS